ncbi:uncharacterized protein LOC143923041 [Arctopsyche grandis]|uniref:uncharacterized protein LOC143923041 n=1 Tax=Arctopsyche grandis TaxID=121162 RepID=UPI00406D69CC
MSGNIGGGALAGLAGHYGSDSDDEAEGTAAASGSHKSMWSMCVDANTGCPYYWDQITNQVSWELPSGVAIATTPIIPPVILANRIQSVDSRALDKISPCLKQVMRPASTAVLPKVPQLPEPPSSDEEEEKIELITSYYNSDSGSGEEIIDETLLSKSQNNITSKKVRTKKDGKKPKDINISSMTQPYGPELPEKFKKSEPKAPPLPNLNVKVNTSDDLLKEQKCDAILNQREGKNNDINTIKSQLLNEKDDVVSAKSDTVMADLQVPNSISSPLGKIEDIAKNDVIGDSNGKDKEIENSNDGKAAASVETDNLDELIMAQAFLLKKLGELGHGEIKYLNGSAENIPSAGSGTHSPLRSPGAANSPNSVKKSTALDMDVDDLIAQIEMEQPVDQPAVSSDVISTGSINSQDGSMTSMSLPTQDTSDSKTGVSFKPLFPSANFASTTEKNLNQKVIDIDGKNSEKLDSLKVDATVDKSSLNKYDTSVNNDGVENSAFKRKRRIALDVLPAKRQILPEDYMFKRDLPYNTKYAQNNEISGERVGLGFSTEADSDSKIDESKANYPNFKKGDSIVFQKGDTLNSDTANKDSNGSKAQNNEDVEAMEETKNLIELKLKFLVKNLPPVPPVQQLSIELQTLWGALASGALQKDYMHDWLLTADTTLARLEASAVPEPWICRFHSGAGCYVYEHAETGKIQWEYPGNEAPPPPTTPPPTKPPAPPSPPPNEPTDMDISTTPPPQSHHEARSYIDSIEPLPPGVETPTRVISPLLLLDDSKIMSSSLSICGEIVNGYKQGDGISDSLNTDKLGAELDSFYSDLATLDDVAPPSGDKKPDKTTVPLPVVKKTQLPKNVVPEDTRNNKEKKKKSKIKTPNTMKDKTVSKLVAKWKKVQETLDD